MHQAYSILFSLILLLVFYFLLHLQAKHDIKATITIATITTADTIPARAPLDNLLALTHVFTPSTVFFLYSALLHGVHNFESSNK